MNAKVRKQRIYLDYAASTPVDPRVYTAMETYWSKTFGNPSALHTEGQEARHAIEAARSTIAHALHSKPSEILFTSGGTESNNMAIFGGVPAGGRCVTSTIEHPSVLDCFKELEKRGVYVSYVRVDENGLLDISHLEQVLTEDTDFVSIMFANNDIGTVQPIQSIAAVLKRKSPQALFHTDASQAPVFYELDVHTLGVDLLTIDGQKMYGPKGIGALYRRHGIELLPIMYGGKQETRLRPGTENVPAIVGMARAYEIAETQRDRDIQKVTEVRDYFIEQLQKHIPTAIVNGSMDQRMPNNVNVSFKDVEGEFLVLQLDKAGIACSARSACFGSGGEGSPVVAAIAPDRAGGAVRFSLGRETTKEEITYVVSVLEEKLKA